MDISLHFVDHTGGTESVKSNSTRILSYIANQLELAFNSEYTIERRTGKRVKVPVLKIQHHIARISLDISIENTDAQKKTCFPRACGVIDPRFRILVCLVKYWAHCRQINDAKYNTLNSTALASATDFDCSLGSSTNNAGPSTALASATDFDGFTPAAADDLYTVWAANRQPAPAGCGGVAYRKLAGVDDLYIARAANRQPAPAGCGGVAYRKLAGVDNLYTARAANRQERQGPSS